MYDGDFFNVTGSRAGYGLMQVSKSTRRRGWRVHPTTACHLRFAGRALLACPTLPHYFYITVPGRERTRRRLGRPYFDAR